MNTINKIFNHLLTSTETIDEICDRWLKAEFVFGTCGAMIAVMVVIGK